MKAMCDYASFHAGQAFGPFPHCFLYMASTDGSHTTNELVMALRLPLEREGLRVALALWSPGTVSVIPSRSSLALCTTP